MKVKARKYELERLQKLQKSKTENLSYSKLELQEYLELKDMNARQAKILFKFRVRMAPFGENFKGDLYTPLCPLCSAHPDTQEESFTCEKISRMMEVQGSYSDIFGFYFPPELIQTLYNIFYFREEYRKLSGKWEKQKILVTSLMLEAHVHFRCCNCCYVVCNDSLDCWKYRLD